MKLIILTCLLGASLSMQVFPHEWMSFKLTHGKQYANAQEEVLRMSIFMDNHKKIEQHNAKYEKGLTSYSMKINHFGDMLPHEIKAKMNGLNYTKSNENSLYSFNFDKTVPDSFDWRTKGGVTPIKNQGQCGSCWAFSAVGALETQLWLKTGKLVSLSEQNLIDCSWDEGNNGCGGGLMDAAFTYIQKNKGIDTESSYPYEANSGECRYQPSDSAGFDVGFKDIEHGNENALKSAVANIGTISVGIDASTMGFMFYSSGILDDNECSSSQLDHGVLAVGYGTENGNDYWIVKNSWGPTWGEQGYIRMRRNKNNQCGISTAASYPVV